MKDVTLDPVESATLSHYQQSASAFWEGTRHHDVTQNIQALLSVLPTDCSLDILDFGCGPGRDLLQFKALGHKPVGLDGCENFCGMAREFSGCDVWQQSFLHLDLPPNRFDGIFANASLFHVPSADLPRVLNELHATLRHNGVLFMSNPRGNAEGWSGDRYGHYMEFETARAFLQQAGFSVVDHYYRPPGKPRDQQPWLAIVSRKSGL
ncbi:MAG TPA: class I SAM-dependent methyltransferase [Pseudomonadales bacterium]|nr:class I SAM-dependent methyltransferase [Pseudomonadales bacterium]